MKRAILIPLIVLLMANMACSLFTGKATEAPAEPTKAVVAPEKATQPPAEKPTEAEPTEAEPTAEEPTEAEPTEAPPTDEPAPTEPTEFKDPFDKDTGKWSDPLVVTTQASGREPNIKITAGSGILRFSVRDKETYVYKYLTEEMPGATTMEVDYVNSGALNAGIAMVCRANEDRTSWYEVRVSGADNHYHFYQYSKERKVVEGKNPYIELSKGVMKYNQFFPMKPNHIVFTCTDTELSVDVNRGKYTASYALDSLIEGSSFGMGVLSADVVPATIDFDLVAIQ